LLPTSEITELTNAIKLSGGRVNTRRNADGTDSPYELNITYLDALRRVRGQTDNLQVERFICSQTIMMSFRGIPAFYIHSLLGTHNYDEGVRLTGMARTINRRKWDTGKLYPMLEKESEHSRIMLELTGRIRIRKKIRAFHPDAPQEVLKETGPVFAMYRGINRELFVVANFSTGKQKFDFSGKIQRQENYLDHIQGKLIAKNGIELEPYQVMWIQKKNKTGIQPVPFPYY
jgi:sucrose phosphorylase